jgi:hypothetical protein
VIRQRRAEDHLVAAQLDGGKEFGQPLVQPRWRRHAGHAHEVVDVFVKHEAPRRFVLPRGCQQDDGTIRPAQVETGGVQEIRRLVGIELLLRGERIH